MEREEKPKEDSKVPDYTFPFQIGRYKALKLIGYGGMGEVFLAEDPVCGREVALKRILEKRREKQSARDRFKKEVRIAAQLAHPSIVPIYDLYEDDQELYYTMPYLEGDTLQEILIKTRFANEHGLPPHMMGGSIASLMLAFLNICQAVEHTHSKGFIHRDLKPDNIIVGKYNEVTILDWGVATEILDEERLKEIEEGDDTVDLTAQTNVRAAAGTIDFMAPERAFRKPATVKTDIYSLGVILHFMLTLSIPYHRPREIKEWRQWIRDNGFEPPIDPQEVAPYREITQQLSRITLKCLHPQPEKRYNTVGEIVMEVERYIQGRPEWIPMQQLEINRLADWQFQESILLTRQMAISRYAGMMEWVLLMLSKESYSGNIQVQASVRILDEGRGLGILMCIPENSGGKGLQQGFLVWIGSTKHPEVKLFRDNVEVMRIENVSLEPGEIYNIAIERQDSLIRLLINDEQKLVYSSHVPLIGGHFGIMTKDSEFEISPIEVSSGSQNVLVNCLSVPDAFLLNKNYDQAVTEYRRIAHSFKGRPEGREATFRGGVVFIEQAKAKKSKAKEYFQKALDEFELLHQTPGAPVEYLGKSLVYHAENNLEEEIKCLELGVRKFPKHPLRHVLDEQILYRLHETAQKDRIGAYAFTLLTLRHIPRVYNLQETDRLTKNLTLSWEDLPFITTSATFPKPEDEQLHISIVLAFWLARPNTLYELVQNLPRQFTHRYLELENALLALMALGYPKLVDFILNVKYRDEDDREFLELKHLYENATFEKPIAERIDLVLSQGKDPLLYVLFDQGITREEAPSLIPHFKTLSKFEDLHLWALLLSRKQKEAEALFKGKAINDPNSPYFMLYGCFLALKKGEEAALAHFATLLPASFPCTPALLGHYLQERIDTKGPWFEQAFLWEKTQLYRQLTLYYTCLDQPRKAASYETLLKKEVEKSQIPLNFI